MARDNQSGNQNHNQNQNTWNDNHRSFNSDDRIMRRGDDRTIESRDWGSNNDRSSHRNEDYPTDKQMSRGSQPRGYNWSQDYSASNDYRPSYDQNWSTQSGSTRDNGWSSDQSSNSWRTRGQQHDSDRSMQGRWAGQDTQGFDRTYGRQDNMYGQGGDLSSSRSMGQGATNFGSATSDSMRSQSQNSYGSRGSNEDSNHAGNNFGGGYYGSGYGSSNYGSNYYGSSTTYGSGLGTGSYSGANNSTSSHVGKGPKNYKRSDERIKEDISDMLERNPMIDASEIELDVKDGVVTLRGHVEDRRTKRAAEDSIETMTGVKDIRNELQVDQSLFQQAKNAIFGESVEQQSASSTNSNKSTVGKSRH